ncbi:arylsulfatase [Nocardioides sp. Root140]|uniref:arylsulfatase n=1 Tax=Nocardioides sp. Root140 TaxID=1736460 RepID=UPI0006F6E50F|nr:arylsulfatase [Nocardioides sp. Root140]KQY54310.1 arylsulfatase [Nocardioides sp. Root140]
MNRKILPVPQPRQTIAPSVDRVHQDPAFPVRERVSPPEGAPNVLVILVDDMGFGASSAYGGPCRMPTADRLAAGGLSYTRFHTTAICAPTRVSLLSGRNHHSAGMGTVPEMATSSPGYDCIRPDTMATLPEILSGNGYLTGAFGKMHQTPMWEVGETGPFDRWPLNEGFDRFYGFIGAETNQFTPALIDGFTPIDPPRTPEEGYHLSEDLVDQATTWIENVSSLEPDRPWFTYLSFGACHDPLHVPESESWRGRYRGEFSRGWTAQREETLARQKELGLVPQDATLPEFDPDVPDWESMGDDERIVCERLMELYAEFAEHMDTQIGRLIDTLEGLGQLDNTLVVYMLGDNGAAAEGGINGSANLVCNLNRVPYKVEDIMAQLDELGGPMTYPHYPVGWALAMNTPYQQSKKYASHYGGTRNGMIVHWPERITEAGVRHQWQHCVDLTPTVLEAAGIPVPDVVDGVPQAPMEGTSFADTFTDADAEERHTTQYFEIHGSRGIYDHGWTAVTRHMSMPWSRPYRPAPPFAEDVWELYDTTSDWTQAENVAEKFPEKLEELKAKFLVEAARYQVLPLDDRMQERFDPAAAPRPDLLGERRSVTLRPSMHGIREGIAPDVKNTSFTIAVDLTVPVSGADGVLIAQGGRFSGWTLYVKDGRPVYCYNRAGERTWVRGESVVPAGEHVVGLQVTYDGGGVGKGADVVLTVDGEACGAGRLERTIGFQFSMDETMDVGRDRGTPVTEEYAAHPRDNAYRGGLKQVRVDLAERVDGPSVEERRRVVMTTH